MVWLGFEHGPQDDRRRPIHCAMAATQPLHHYNLFKFFRLVTTFPSIHPNVCASQKI